MTDLNSPLTNLDSSLIEAPAKAPELKPFSVWSSENSLEDSPSDSYVQYSDYMREEYLNAGVYDDKADYQINEALFGKLQEIAGEEEVDFEAATAAKELSFNDKATYVFSSPDLDSPTQGLISQYLAGEKAIAGGGANEEYKQKIMDLRGQIESTVNNKFEGLKGDLVDTEQLPLAYVTNAEGERELIAGSAAANMTPLQAIKASKLGGVSLKDALKVQALLSTVEGTNTKVYRYKKLKEISEGIATLSESDSAVAEHVEAHILHEATKDNTWWDDLNTSIGRIADSALTAIGVQSEEQNDRKNRVYEGSEESFVAGVEDITRKLNAAGGNYSTLDVKDAYESHIIERGVSSGKFKFKQDPSEAGGNLYNTALGPVINPSALLREEDLRATLAAHPELSENQKQRFMDRRVEIMESEFSTFSKRLSNSVAGDDWAAALIQGRMEGKSNTEILVKFTETEDNFNELVEGAKGLAFSVSDSLASLVYFAPIVAEKIANKFADGPMSDPVADWGREGLVKIAERQSERRAVAELFGEQYGLFQEVGESIAPLIVDVAATAVLGSFTLGAGGAAYLTTRQGARLTIKGLGKSLTSNVLRVNLKKGGREGLEKVADYAIANNLIKTSLAKQGTKEGTEEVIKALTAYNNRVVQKFGIGVATFVPAATRGSAMTYSSIYSQLIKDPSITKEEANDRALGFALVSGAFTGVLTAALGAVGRGGVDDALLRGMTFRESKTLLKSMGAADGIEDQVVAGAFRKVLSESLKKHGKGGITRKIARNAWDESYEEGIDQFVNSYIEDVALNQETPMLERFQQAAHAGLIGGILGGGVPAIQSVASRVGVTPIDRIGDQIRLGQEFDDGVAKELQNTGSPKTAEEVRRIRQTRISDRPTPTPEPSFSDQARAQEEELQNELLALSDENTLPQAEAERPPEVARREKRRAEIEGELATLSQTQESTPTPLVTGETYAEKVEILLDSLSNSDRLDVESTFENLRAGNDIQETSSLTYLDGAQVDFSQVENSAAKVGVATDGEARRNVAQHNSRTSDLPLPPTKQASQKNRTNQYTGSAPFKGDNGDAKNSKVIGFAVKYGLPVNYTATTNYGLPSPSLGKFADRKPITEFISSVVYAAYPTTDPPKGATPSGRGFVKADGVGVFNNDPIAMIDLLKAGVGVPVPNSFNRSSLNPAIRVRNGRVVDVVGPTVEGVLLESKIVAPRNVASVEPDTTTANAISRIPFKAATLPDGVRDFDPVNGGPPQPKSSTKRKTKFDPLDEFFKTTTVIKRRLSRFQLELGREGADENLFVRNRFVTESGPLTPEFEKAALSEASSEFFLNAQLFSLRQKYFADSSSIVGEVIAQTNSKSEVEAAQRLFPLITIPAGQTLSNKGVIEEFVKQKIVENPALANNTPPTFSSLLQKSVNRFQREQGKAESIRDQRANATLPSDVDPEEFRSERVMSWVANFGTNPEGPTAPIESINLSITQSVDKAIKALEDDSLLQNKIKTFTIENIIDEPSQEVARMVASADARSLFGIFSSWVISSNGNTRKELNTLMEDLGGESSPPSGVMFRDSLILTQLANRADGKSFEDADAVAEFQEKFMSLTGTDITMDEARNTMIALTKASHSFLSRSNISDVERAAIQEQNLRDLNELGIESGNPESVVAALKTIAKSSDNPSHKVAADLLLRGLDFVKGVSIVVGSSKADIAGKYIKGNDGSHTVFLNTSSGNGRGIVNTMLEEYIHAFVSGTISGRNIPESLRRGVATRLNNINETLSNARTAYAAEVAKTGPNPVLANALVNANEFFAHFFLSSEVRSHVSSLAAPAQKGPFMTRLLSDMVSLFPNVKRGEVAGLVDSISDLLDVGKNSRKLTPSDAKPLGSAIASRTLSAAPPIQSESQINEMASAQAEAAEARELQLAEVASAQAREVQANLQKFIDSNSNSDSSRAELQRIVDYVRSILPAGMSLELTGSGKSPAFVSKDSLTVTINPVLLMQDIEGFPKMDGDRIIESIINEEITHIAALNSLTIEELQGYIDSLSDQDYDDIAVEYLSGSPAEFLEATRLDLKSEDPQVVQEAKFKLAHEKLRMYAQSATRGYTTESDRLFWKSRPSAFAILKRYMAEVIRNFASYVGGRKSPDPRAHKILDKMIIEMRAIEAGFVRQPASMQFDPENPMAVFKMFNTVNQDFVGLATAPVVGEYPDSAEFPTSAYNTIHGGADIPSGLSDNNEVAAYLRDQGVEFWGVEVNEDGNKPVGDEETFLTPITAKSITSEQEAKIVDIATEETLQALAADGEDAADWYSTSVESAMAIASVIYPELSNADLAREFKAFSSSKNPDQAADLVMKMALAITSQNLKVSENTRYADKQYKIFRETGRFDESAVYGSKAAAIQSNLILANAFIAKLGFDKTIEFIESDFTVKSLNQELKKLGLDVKVDGTNGTQVQGAAIFGPKIGQGFLQNLRASVMKVAGKGYIPVTVDLWLRRTWGRWTGDSAGKGLTTNLVAEFLRVARETKTMPDISEDLVEKVAKSYAEIESEDTKAEPNDNHISRARSAIKGVRSLRLNKTRKDLTKKSSESLSDNPDYQIAVFVMGKFVNSRGEKAYQRTRDPLPPEIIDNIRKGDYDPLEIFTYLENRSSEFENTYVGTKGVPKADAKKEFFKNFDGSEEIMEPKAVRGLKLPWQNVAKRVKESIKPIDSPTNLEREVISRVINKVRINLESLGMSTTNADIQAILWYPEKDIWQKLQGGNADSLKMSYDQAYENLAKELGPEIYEKAIEARQEIVRRRRDRTARNSIAPQQGADGAANRGTVGNSGATETGSGRAALSTAPIATGGRGTRSRSGWGGRAEETPLVGAPTVYGIKGGIPRVIQAAKSYATKVGIPHVRQEEYVKIDPAFSSRLAKAYAEMKHDPDDPKVKEAYTALVNQTKAQYEALVENGLSFWFFDSKNDPYDDKPWRAIKGLRDTNSMGVFPTEEGFGSSGKIIARNPLEEDTGLMWSYGSPDGPKKRVLANDLFRAVHDAFGHGLEGAGFRAQGEENAWQAHVRLFYGSAVHAMTSETRGQNSWVNFGPKGSENQVAMGSIGTTFADQHVGLMPSWAWTERVSPDEPMALSSAPTGQPTGAGIDFSAVVDLLEIPVYEMEAGKERNFLSQSLINIFAGEVPKPFRRLIQNRKAYQRSVESIVEAYHNKTTKLIEEAYGEIGNAPVELIARAQGYVSGSLISEEVQESIEAQYENRLDVAQQRKLDGDTDFDVESYIELAIEEREAALSKAEEDAKTFRENERDEALQLLAKDSPDLAAHIVDIREKLIIPIQKKMFDGKGKEKEDGSREDFKVKFSHTGGLYITRSYRMFTDSSYFKRVSEDPDYADVRELAMEEFDKQFLKKTENDLVTAGVPRQEAKLEARRALDSQNQLYAHSSHRQEMLHAFLARYSSSSNPDTGITPRGYEMLMNNLKERKDLPEPFRKLLGEYDAEEGVKLSLRTFSTVATMASQQTFIEHLKKYGVDMGILVETSVVEETRESKNEYARRGFVPARRGEGASTLDALSGYYIDETFKRSLDVTLKESTQIEFADTAEKAITGIFGVVANLTGKSMALKTLGSVGHYLRNAIGNFAFGMSQGYFGVIASGTGMFKAVPEAFFGENGEPNPIIAELIGLNVMGDELRAGVMRDLLNGKVTPEGIKKQIEDLGEKTKLNLATKAIAKLEEKAQKLSAGLDAAYKVAYYSHELTVLKEAQAADTTGKLSILSEMQIKRLAADKVMMTAQSYSQAPPFVKAFSKSGLGLVFAPFIRFKIEIPRIIINTYKLASKEMNSGNPVLVTRGVKRLAGMTGTLGIFSSAFPMILASMSGIGDEEDEALRASMPDYLRGHTFYYFKGDDGKITSYDLTYLNPFALMVDPFLRAYENLRSGEFVEAGVSLATGLITDEYLDDQILAGAVLEAKQNLNPATGKPIWNKGADDPAEAAFKVLSYITREAYAPRIGKDFVEGVRTQSAKGFGASMVSGMVPVRPHEIDLQSQYKRYLMDVKTRYTNVRSGLGAVMQSKEMSQEEVTSIMEENIEDRRRLNEEMLRINKGFESLGISTREQAQAQNDMKFGKRRMALMRKGFMEAPSIKYILQRLNDPSKADYGPDRAQMVYDARAGINRFIRIRPISESD